MSDPDGPPAIADLLRRNLQQLREDRGLSRSRVAAIAQQRGFTDWTQDAVKRIESGRRRLTLEEFLGLPLIFPGYSVRDLFRGTDVVALNSGQSSAVDALLGALAGRTDIAPERLAIPSPGTISARASISARPAVEGRLHAVQDHVLGRIHGSQSLTRRLKKRGLEPRPISYDSVLKTKWDRQHTAELAQKLRVDELTLMFAALVLYGRPLVEERDARALSWSSPGDSQRTLQAKRGRATHQITQELKEILDGFN